MFKKIAHNSTIPALAGNRDLRPLQDLITAEKTVLQTLHRLSVDIGKSSELLRHWGSGEGDALQNTLNASATLLTHFATALAQYASHEQTIREHMKAVRTREEDLDELKRRRKTVIAKADSAEKKLSRMSPENKSLQQQTELLNSLREQIRNLDWDILADEAKLGDFKRSSAKNWMMLKFGGLLECAEKATIVGELGKLVIDEIPLDITQPGHGPPFYHGFEKTEKLVAEAQRCISEVVFDPVTAELQQSTRSGPQPSSPDGNTLSYPERPFAASQLEGLPSDGSGPQSNRNSGIYSALDGLPSLGIMPGSQSNFAPTFQQDQASTPDGNVDEFGFADRERRGFGTMPMPSAQTDGHRFGTMLTDPAAGSSSASPSSSRFTPSGGHFATFPVRKSSLTADGPSGQALPPPPQLSGPPSSFKPLDNAPSESSSFSAEIADALAHGSNFSSAGGQHQHQPTASQGSFSVRSSTDGPAPSYESHAPPPPPFSMSTSGLPRGAAPPVDMNPWNGSSLPPPRFPQDAATPRPSDPLPLPPVPPAPQYRPAIQADTQIHDADSEDDTELPYASPPPQEAPHLPQIGSNSEDRHVHFGGSGGDNGQAHVTGEGSMHERNPSEYNASGVQTPIDQQHAERIPSPPPQLPSERIPSPGPPMDEHSLNVAAAREVAREMDSLSFSPPAIAMIRSPSPLMPPAPPFAQYQPPPNEGATLAPASSGMFRGSRTDIRSGSADQLGTPPPPNTLQQPRPAFGASPATSFTSSAYGTPPEYPSPSIFQPPRTSSPASPSVHAPGTRTISASAFKRPQMRAASGESRPLPEITPLALRKKNGLPGSPYTSPVAILSERGRSPGPASPMRAGQEPFNPSQDQQRPRRSVDSAQNAQDHYDFIASYGDSDNAGTSPPRQRPSAPGETSGSPGYGSGKFATNLEDDGLR